MMNQDQEHLRLLSIFHYVLAAIAALFSLMPVIHIAMGIAMLSGAFEQQKGPDAQFIGWLFVLLGGVFIVFGLAYAVLISLAGKYLVRRTHYTFCLVIACISCAFMPFGTVLGVFTIIVLNRDSVKELFGHGMPTGTASSDAT